VHLSILESFCDCGCAGLGGLRETSAFNVWKQVILLYRRGSPSEVRTKFRWIEPKQRLDLDSSLRDGGWGAHGWNWASLSAGRNIDLRVSLVAEARESNTVGYASASAAANKAGAPSPRKSSPRWMHHSLRFETNFEPIGLSNQGIQWRFGTITIKLSTSAGPKMLCIMWTQWLCGPTCLQPKSRLGRRLIGGSMRRIRVLSMTRRSISGAGNLRTRSGIAMFSKAMRCG
jgi:hypothetical protein